MIKEYREKTGLTQADLARQAGVSVKTISNLENKRKSIGDVKVDTAVRIAMAMGISVTELIGTVLELEDKILYTQDFILYKKERKPTDKNHGKVGREIRKAGE